MSKIETHQGGEGRARRPPGAAARRARGLGDARPTTTSALLKWYGLYAHNTQRRPLHAAHEGRPGRAERRPGRGRWPRSPRTSAAGSSTARRASASRSTGSRSRTSPRSSRASTRVGLTTTGACGDITRNVVGCTLAGLGHDEIVDGYATAEAHPRALPRQQALLEPPAQVQDLGHRLRRGLRARPDQRHRAVGGDRTTTARAGFNLRVGGGLSTAAALRALDRRLRHARGGPRGRRRASPRSSATPRRTARRAARRG